jgi:hypothetical protein
MILARVAPDRTPPLMARAAEYAESRLICGVHFPSDVADSDSPERETYALLRRLNKPTDLFIMATRAHVVTDPGVPIAVQGNTVPNGGRCATGGTRVTQATEKKDNLVIPGLRRGAL